MEVIQYNIKLISIGRSVGGEKGARKRRVRREKKLMDKLLLRNLLSKMKKERELSYCSSTKVRGAGRGILKRTEHINRASNLVK